MDGVLIVLFKTVCWSKIRDSNPPFQLVVSYMRFELTSPSIYNGDVLLNTNKTKADVLAADTNPACGTMAVTLPGCTF